jgi:hypothetical protein
MPAPRQPQQSGVLTAGDVDDNLNFAAFASYADRYTKDHGQAAAPALTLSDRITFEITDARGQPVSNARIKATRAGGAPAFESYAGTDGVFRLFPQADGLNGAQELVLTIAAPDGSNGKEIRVDSSQLDAKRRVKVTLDGVTGARPAALDLMFVIDATGSMSDEMAYLNREFTDIMGAVHDRFPGVSIRYSLIVYRDNGDAYVVRGFPFTEDVAVMQKQLGLERAGGGGDYPEAMDQAMDAALKKSWRVGNAGRLLFLVADAPPHDNRLAATLDTFKAARAKGIRVCPLAASGVGDKAEYIMRHGAVLTHGRHLFLTDDSGVGHSHKEPSIAGYVVTRLDQLIGRVIASELAGKRVEPQTSQIIRTVGYYEAGFVVPRGKGS